MQNESIQTIEMFDMSGKMVRNSQSPKQVQVINVNDLQPNVYLLRIHTAQGVRTSKVVVQ